MPVPSKNEANLRCRIPEELKEAVKEQAKKEERTETAVVVRALRRYMEDPDEEATRKVLRECYEWLVDHVGSPYEQTSEEATNLLREFAKIVKAAPWA